MSFPRPKQPLTSSMTQTDNATTFKGHPQDPPPEMLQRMYNFLADEDPNRCLKFEHDKLPQIEEYVKYVEDEKLVDDNDKATLRLLKNVKIMAEVQRDWLSRGDAPPRETTCCDAPAALNYSTRLMSLETVGKIQEQRDSAGLSAHMRADHPPFTVERSSDQHEFLEALAKDGNANPNSVDEDENLIFVEGRAYDWALTQPSLIPFWLKRDGLPNTGKPTWKTPWYRDARKPNVLFMKHPSLPGYLAKREYAINDLLKIQNPTSAEVTALWNLLYLHEPKDIRKRHDAFLRAQDEVTMLSRTPEDLEQFINDLKAQIDPWIETLRTTGVVIITSKDWAESTLGNTLPPGSWYIRELRPSEQAISQLKEDEIKINEVLKREIHKDTPNPRENDALRSILAPYLPHEHDTDKNEKEILLQALQFKNISLPLYNQMSESEKIRFHKDAREKFDNKDPIYERRSLAYRSLALALVKEQAEVELRYRLVGQIAGTKFPTSKDRLCILHCLWDPEAAPLPVDAGRPGSEIKWIETEINTLLTELAGTNRLSDVSYLQSLLEHVMPQWLRRLAGATQLTGSPVEDEDVATYKKAYIDWRDALTVTGVEVRIPLLGHKDPKPNALFYRNIKDIPADCSNAEVWMTKINAILPEIPEYNDAGRNPEREQYYTILEPLQYSALRRLDQAWRKISDDKSDQPLKRELKNRWMRSFFAWIKTFRNRKVEIARGGQELDSPYPPNDPSIVFYRGPLHGADIDENIPRLGQQAHNHQVTVQNILDRHSLNLPLSIDEAEELEKLICLYWKPGVEYNALQNPSDEETETYKSKLELFIRACAVSGFVLIKPADSEHGITDALIAHDTSVQLPWGWIPGRAGARHGFVFTASNLKEELEWRWPYPQRFYEAVSDLEQEINRALRELKHSSLSDYANLQHLLYPFLTPTLRSFEHRIRSANGDEKKMLTDLFNSHFASWIRSLQQHSRQTTVTIRDVDVDENWDFTYPKLEGVLIFRRPKGKETDPMDIAEDEAVPKEFAAVEKQINILLRKFHYKEDHPENPDAQKVFTWEDDDELRRLLHAVMEPKSMAIDELEYRAREERYRAGLSQGVELAIFLQESATYRYHYKKWVLEMPRSGIKLRKLTQNSSRDNTDVYFLHLDHPDELPPKFTSGPNTALPEDIVAKTKDINEFVSNEENLKGIGEPGPSKSEKDFFYQLLLTLWVPTRAEIVKQYMKTAQPLAQSDGPRADPRRLVAFRGQLKSRLSMWASQLSQRVSSQEIALEIYEPIRGDLALRQRNLSTNEIEPDVNMDVVSRPIPSLQEAMDQFEPLYAKVKNKEQLNSRDRTQVLKSLQYPDSLDDPDVSKKRSANQTVTKERILAKLWRAMSDIYPSELEQAVPLIEYKDALDNLLQNDDMDYSPVTLPTPPTKDELVLIETEINNMLNRSEWHHPENQQELLLNFLLRPLLQGNLGQLFRDTCDLIKKARTQGVRLTATESFALAEYSKQFNEQFIQWKKDIAKRGVILDDGGLLRDSIVLNSMVGRYRNLQTAIRESRRPVPDDQVSSTVLENPAVARLKAQFQLLRAYLSNTGTAVDNSKLALTSLPQPLADAHDKCFIAKAAPAQETSEDDLMPDPHTLLLTDVTNTFVEGYLTWFSNIPPNVFRGYQIAAKQRNTDITDFSGKAERRGVQRASIELGLNLLATNQEQHRPHDRFRKVRFPPKYQLPPEECPLWLPLKPYERPIEMEPFEYAGLMRKYRQWKDYDYSTARERDMAKFPHEIPAPPNFNGPSTLTSEEEYREILTSVKDRLQRLHYSILQAQTKAPRRLLRRLLELIDEGMRNCGADHPLLDDNLLEEKDIAVLRELTKPSWSEGFEEYTDVPRDALPLLHEFEPDIKDEQFWSSIPYWETGRTRRDSSLPDELREHGYDGSLPSLKYSLLVDDSKEGGLLQRLNAWRDTKDLRPWTIEEVTEFLLYMATAKRIHFDDRFGGVIARIPPNGHPENKYVISEQDATEAPYISYDPDTHKFTVQYDSFGLTGRPILQPNKYEYLQKIAFRLGREIGDLLFDLTQTYDTATRAEIQAESSNRAQQILEEITEKEHDPNAKEISLQRIALDLHKIAPDLAAEKPDILQKIQADPDSLTEQEAATLIQMELIQEINNNWESRFPVNEHVWDFAASRLEKTIQLPGSKKKVAAPVPRYFDMQRWPLPCQGKETQRRIMESGPRVIEEEEAEGEGEQPPPQEARAEMRTDLLQEGPRLERHTGRGQRPYFPFGETPYQQAYLSFRMEEDLKDVEEFNPKPPRDLWSRILRKFRPTPQPPSIDRTALPEVHGWVPNSVSEYQKHIEEAERKLADPNLPDQEELYFTPAEIYERRRREAIIDMTKRQAEARKLVEKYWTKKQWFGSVSYDELTNKERREAWDSLNIDPLREVVRTPPPPPEQGESSSQPASRLGPFSRAKRAAPATRELPNKRQRGPPPRRVEIEEVEESEESEEIEESEGSMQQDVVMSGGLGP